MSHIIKKVLVVWLFCSSWVYAHNLLMNVMNNEDNTITVMGEFSTGELAFGAMVRLESLVSGDVLFKERLPQISELTIEIPKEPYQIVLDGGPGHTIVKEGIAPLEGFVKEFLEQTKKSSKLSQSDEFRNDWSLPMIVMFTFGLILVILTLYFSAKNTQILMKQLKQN